MFFPRVDVSYKSDIFLGLDRGSFEVFREDIDLGGQEAFTLVGARLGWANRDEDINVALFVRNVTDERYLKGTASVAGRSLFQDSRSVRPRANRTLNP